MVLKKAQNVYELLENCPKNETIRDNLIKAWWKVNDPKYKKILCSISGGGDSDVMLDIVWKCDKDNKVDYVWFDTGIEYQATKDHLKYLEDKYGIGIMRYKAIKSVPLSCRQYGQPFLSKLVSAMIYALQRQNFKWEDKPYEELQKEYKGIDCYLKWWCNYGSENHKHYNQYDIGYKKYLKEFLIQNPPVFKISSKCCDYAKKKVSHSCIKLGKYDLVLVGVRKAEGGIRSVAYKSCFDETSKGYDNYRPVFWYSDSDKADYENTYNIKHSDCYEVYGFKRTGCVGCPYNQKLDTDLAIIEKYEPKLYKVVNNVFKDSYEYTKKYKEFCKQMDEKYGSYANYLKLKKEGKVQNEL